MLIATFQAWKVVKNVTCIMENDCKVTRVFITVAYTIDCCVKPVITTDSWQ